MSKKTATIKSTNKAAKPAPAKDAAANDKARAAALAALTAKASDARTSKPPQKEDAASKSPTQRAKPGTKTATKAVTKRMSALDAAAQVLQGLPAKDAKSGLSSQDLIDRMAAAGLWASPGGRTPAATLYAAMIREIASKGGASRFVRLESADGSTRGRFAASSASRIATASENTASKPRRTTSAATKPAPTRPAPAKPAVQKGRA